jgi:transcriptional regulator with XRE-family HTH domain
LAAKQTQWQVAEAVDVRVPTISGIERGERFPSVELLWDLAGSLRVSVADLLPAHDLDDVSDGPTTEDAAEVNPAQTFHPPISITVTCDGSTRVAFDAMDGES